MAICSGCGAQIEEGTAFCPDCGKKQESVAASTEQAQAAAGEKDTAGQTDTTGQADTAKQSENAASGQFSATGSDQNNTQSQYGAQNQYGGQSQYGAQNQYGGQSQYGAQNQYGGQSQYGAGNQYGGQSQYGTQNQYGGQSQYGNNMNGGSQQYSGYAAPVKKDKLAAGLFALFLGTFGIHKFYLGYTKEGLIMLLVSLIGGTVSCGIATGAIAIVALVEGIMYLTKSDEEFYQTYVVGHKGWC
ncbi:MAG: NINE protein [Lachnospiraceae bacterium]|nr:NINE protein [Lachnospiraceae bacterium]